MKILHIAAHLGGGIGKAHAAINRAMVSGVEQTYVLLEEPVDRRHFDVIRRKSEVVVTTDLIAIQHAARDVDVVQFEFWGHPLFDDLMGRLSLRPSDRTVCWSHVSGLSPLAIPSYLLQCIDRFVATSLITVPAVGDCVVINSGFGFDDQPSRTSSGICYLGTVDFKKIHPKVFEVVDKLDTEVSFWGHVGPGIEDAVARMRYPERVRLRGHTMDPAAALSEASVFFYPLRSDHYGTAENALVEAMSLGLVPVVMGNQAELEIVRHGVTGLVAQTPAGLAAHLRFLASSPTALEILSRNATRETGKLKYSPANSASALANVWQDLVAGRTRMYA